MLLTSVNLHLNSRETRLLSLARARPQDNSIYSVEVVAVVTGGIRGGGGGYWKEKRSKGSKSNKEKKSELQRLKVKAAWPMGGGR